MTYSLNIINEMGIRFQNINKFLLRVGVTNCRRLLSVVIRNIVSIHID